MVNEIQVTVHGYVGAHPTLRMPRDGSEPFTTIRVASTHRFWADGEWKNGRTQWFAVKLNGELARNVCNGVRKGDNVLVRGRLDYEEYTNKEGEPAWDAVIRANAFGLEMSRALVTSTRIAYTGGEGEPEEPGPGEPEDAPLDMTGYREVSDDGEALGTADADPAPDAEEGTDDRPIVDRIGVPF